MTVEECKEQRAILEIGLLWISQATVDGAVVEHETILCFQIPGVRMSPRPVDPNLSWRTSKPEGNSVETRTTAGNAFSLKQARKHIRSGQLLASGVAQGPDELFQTEVFDVAYLYRNLVPSEPVPVLVELT